MTIEEKIDLLGGVDDFYVRGVPRLVYVAARFPKVERPPKELKGFAKVNLRAGEKRRVTLRLDKRVLSYYDPRFQRVAG